MPDIKLNPFIITDAAGFRRSRKPLPKALGKSEERRE